MNFLQELKERGFFFDCTDEQGLSELDNITAYIGFDCTAKSLHAGSLIQIMILRLLQKHGHKPLVLLGGGTTKIGDPSGKDEARKVLSEEQIQENLQGIRKVLEKFLKFEGENAAQLVDNNDWLEKLSYLDFLRKFGSAFSINKMLTFDCIKNRLSRQQALSFLEFNYMIFQSYDFYELNKRFGCQVQIGGSDQWGNITSGVDLIRRKGNKAFGLTTPLLTTSKGEKMGKTGNNTLWLDGDPYIFYQYFRNSHDADVPKFLRLFTELNLEEIKQLEKLEGQEINKAKAILAKEITLICFGKDGLEIAESETIKKFGKI